MRCVWKTNQDGSLGSFLPILHFIPLTTFVLNTSVSNNDMTRDQHNNKDMNPTKGLGAM